MIPQDRSSTAIELETVLDDLLPLLRTIQPEKLTRRSTRSPPRWRAGASGSARTSARRRLLLAAQPQLPQLKTDITGLADVSEIYADAAPDLARILRNFSVSSNTIAEKAETYAGFLAGTAGFATTTRDFLAANEQRIIQVNAVGRPTLELLAEYSPEYPCLLQGLTQSNDFIGKTFANGELHITLEVVRARPGYKPGEEPRWGEDRGPQCYGLPSPPRPWPGTPFDDGTQKSTKGRAVPGHASALVDPSSGRSGTAAEQRLVDALVAPQLGVRASEVPDLATLLFGPMARGTAVAQS